METRLKFQTLIDLFNQSLSKIEQLDKVCLEIIRAERQEKLTFQQLKTKAQDFAVWLIQAIDSKPKDKIAILGKNRADWDVAFWGSILAGAVPVLIDPDRPIEAVKKHILHTETRTIIMADDYQDTASQRELKDFATGRNINLIEMTIFEKTTLSNTKTIELLSQIQINLKADDTAVILCTSGTTAEPQEVELTHANLIANIEGSLQKIKLTSKDKLGHILPPHHCFGLTVGKLLPFAVGATSIYTNKYRQIPELIRDKEMTIFVAIPALFTVLAKNMEENLAKEKRKKQHIGLIDRYLPKMLGKKMKEKLGWTNLRFFLSGAAPLPRWVLQAFWRRGILLYEGYGTTENSPVYGFNDNPRKLGSVGKPITTLLVKIVDEKNQALSATKVGEICLGGPCIMKGYHKNHTVTEQVIETDTDGVRWLHTGDLGYVDSDGYLFITGRKKYLIVLPGGKKVNPELVEIALSQAQYVKEILVVPGFHKDHAGNSYETVRAIVHPDWDLMENNTKLSHSELIKQPQVIKNLIWQSIHECQQKSRHLSNFEKVSSQNLEIKIDEFQKTSTGKIKRQVYIKG